MPSRNTMSLNSHSNNALHILEDFVLAKTIQRTQGKFRLHCKFLWIYKKSSATILFLFLMIKYLDKKFKHITFYLIESNIPTKIKNKRKKLMRTTMKTYILGSQCASKM